MKNKADKIYVYPESFGAIGDGITDDTEAFKSMLDSIKKDSDTYNRTIVLTGKYILNEPIEIIDRLRIQSLKKDRNLGTLLFGDTVESAFVETSSPIVSGRIWNFELDRISISTKGTIFNGTLQWWRTKFTECIFDAEKIFEGCKFYLSTINQNQFTCTEVSHTGFTIIDTWFSDNNFNFKKGNESGGIFFNLKNCTTSRIIDNYFTLGIAEEYTGTYCGIQLENCRTLIISRNIFDVSNGNIIEIKFGSSFIGIYDNVFRGWGSMADYDDVSEYKRNPAIYLNGCKNVIISGNSFSKFIASGVFPSLKNKAHYLLEGTNENINIENNMYEDNLVYYESNENAINERLYNDAIIFDIPY